MGIVAISHTRLTWSVIQSPLLTNQTIYTTHSPRTHSLLQHTHTTQIKPQISQSNPTNPDPSRPDKQNHNPNPSPSPIRSHPALIPIPQRDDQTNRRANRLCTLYSANRTHHPPTHPISKSRSSLHPHPLSEFGEKSGSHLPFPPSSQSGWLTWTQTSTDSG